MTGQAIPVELRWNRTCHSKTHCYEEQGGHDSPFHDEHCYKDELDCDPLPFDMEVRCSGASAGACPTGTSHVETGKYVFDIIPTHAGELQIAVNLVHSHESKVDHRVVTVHDPDQVRVPPSVPTTHPHVPVELSVDGTVATTTIARVNGKPLAGGAANLADLFPDRRAGEGVAAGTYELTIDVGAFHEVVNVEAVPTTAP